MWEESPKEAAESLQKMLRGRLKYLNPPLADWAEQLMLQQCDIKDDDLVAILTSGRALQLETLKKVEEFVRRWQAGGITRDGSPVVDPRSAYIGGIQIDKPITADATPPPATLVPESSGPTRLEKIIATLPSESPQAAPIKLDKPFVFTTTDVVPRTAPHLKRKEWRHAPPAVEPDEIISPSKSMQWHCRDCHENFKGPESHPPKDGCPLCGSHNVFDCNASELPGAIKRTPRLPAAATTPRLPAPPIPQPQAQPKPTPSMPKKTDIPTRQTGLAKRHEGLNITGGRSHQAFRLLTGIEDPATMHSFRHGNAALSDKELDRIESAIEQWPNRKNKVESNGSSAPKVKPKGKPKAKAKRTQVKRVKYEDVASDDPVTTESLEDAIAAVKDAETSLFLAKKALADLSRRYAEAA